MNLGSGSSERTLVGVRVSPSAPSIINTKSANSILRFFYSIGLFIVRHLPAITSTRFNGIIRAPITADVWSQTVYYPC